MNITVQLQLDAALQLQADLEHEAPAATHSQDVSQLLETLDSLGATIAPVHPGQSHPLLAPFFTVEAPDTESPAQVIERLSQLKAVEAAYVRPQDELP